MQIFMHKYYNPWYTLYSHKDYSKFLLIFLISTFFIVFCSRDFSEYLFIIDQFTIFIMIDKGSDIFFQNFQNNETGIAFTKQKISSILCLKKILLRGQRAVSSSSWARVDEKFASMLGDFLRVSVSTDKNINIELSSIISKGFFITPRDNLYSN